MNPNLPHSQNLEGLPGGISRNDDDGGATTSTQHTEFFKQDSNAIMECTNLMDSISLRSSRKVNVSLPSETTGDFVDKLDSSESQRRQREALHEDQVGQEIGRPPREHEPLKGTSVLLRPLTDEEAAIVKEAVYDEGNDPHEVMAESGKERVIRRSMQMLRPGRWLNDEVIHFFLHMLAKRDEEICRNEPARKRTHFFNSFFVTKLLNEGHNTKDGEYEYHNVKRWTKKVPDIFQLNKIVFPINQRNMHWVCAVAFMQEKKIAFLDSMGSSGEKYLVSLKRWITDEHQETKGSPLQDAGSWKLVTCDASKTPQQKNGFDCGVFTCMFADFISNDCPLVFDQNHIKQCRERIAIAIMKGKAII